MPRRARRYVVGSLSGAAVVGASVVSLHLLPSTGVTAGASIQGSSVVGCSVAATVTSCQQPAPRPAGSARSGTYRDGVYQATGHYLTPGGSESLGVSLTLAQGVVTAARVQVEATSPTARQFQTQFAARYAAQVIAKDVSEVRVSRVAGASLTSVGFNDAITSIKVSARD